MSHQAPDIGIGSLLDALDVGLIVLDEQSCVAVWNEWVARATRMTADSVAGQSLYDLFPSLRTTRLPGAIEDAFRAGSSSILTHTLNRLLPLRGDAGQDILHNVVVRPVMSGDTRYCLLQINDVTIAVTRERVLRERQNARYRAIADSAPDAIITTDQDRTIQWMNGAAERVFGPSSDLLGRHVDALVADGASLDVAFRPENALQAGPISVVGRRGHGDNRHFEVSYAPWEADGRGFVTTIWRDVTDRLAAEASLREAQESLLRANEELEARVAERTREREVALSQLHEAQKMESIGQLTGGVAHDFNNLLAVILGSLSLLKKTISDDPRTSRLIEGAIQGAERGATLTKRLLAFARRQELKLQAVEVQKLIPDLLDFLRQSLGPNIAVRVEIPSDIRPINIDVNQLELAVMNLAVNARDAMPGGGTLTITCTNATLVPGDEPKELRRGNYVRLSIADTGEGMSAETLARAMEPFFTTKGVGKGTGLGLSMVQGMTAQSGGAMRITSQPGAGTEVTLWLPCAHPDELVADSSHQKGTVINDPTRQLRILLVDDDSLVSMNTAYMLMDLGHSVLEAPSGDHALKLIQSDAQFDIVITDYAMPGMNGHDLAVKIKQLKPRMPIILATGYAELPSASPSEFPRLSKPYSQEHLAQALDEALGASQPERSDGGAGSPQATAH